MMSTLYWTWRWNSQPQSQFNPRDVGTQKQVEDGHEERARSRSAVPSDWQEPAKASTQDASSMLLWWCILVHPAGRPRVRPRIHERGHTFHLIWQSLPSGRSRGRNQGERRVYSVVKNRLNHYVTGSNSVLYLPVLWQELQKLIYQLIEIILFQLHETPQNSSTADMSSLWSCFHVSENVKVWGAKSDQTSSKPRLRIRRFRTALVSSVHLVKITEPWYYWNLSPNEKHLRKYITSVKYYTSDLFLVRFTIYQLTFL